MIWWLLPLVSVSDAPSFAADVAPILHRRCASCHMGDKAKGGWSAETYGRLTVPGDTGETPLVPGNPGASELFRLMASDDEFERMPSSGDPVPAEELEVLRDWIQGGAEVPTEQQDVSLAELSARSTRHAPAPEHYAHPLAVTALSFTADGQRILTSGVREVLAFDVTSGRLVHRYGGLPQRIHSIVPEGEGSIAVAGGLAGSAGELRRVALGGGEVAPAVDVFRDLALGVAVSSDGTKLAACAADGSVACYDASTGRRLWKSELHTDHVADLAFTATGEFVITASRDHSAKVYAAETGELWTSYTRHTQTLPDREMYQHAIFAVATGPGSDRVVTAGEGGEVHVWEPRLYRAEDGTASQMETRFKAKSHVRTARLSGGDILDLAVTADTIYAATRSGEVVALDARPEGGLKATVLMSRPGDACFSLALSPDGERLAAGTSSGRIFLWDLLVDPSKAPAEPLLIVRP